MDYDTAVAQLQTPKTWCQGAKRLTQLAELRALVPLLAAYEHPFETSKLCLLDAMETLGPAIGARELYENGKGDERRLGIHLLELFPSEEALPILEKAVADPDAAVRAQARRALACQKQTPKWEALVLRLLETADEEGRAQAIESLSHRRGEAVRKALAGRLKVEQSGRPARKIGECFARCAMKPWIRSGQGVRIPYPLLPMLGPLLSAQCLWNCPALVDIAPQRK